MGLLYRSSSVQDESAEYLLDVPYEAYADSPIPSPENEQQHKQFKQHQQFQVEIELELPQARRQVGPAAWHKLTTCMPFRNSSTSTSTSTSTSSLPSKEPPPFKAKPRCSCCLRLCSRALLVFFAMLGVIQFISLAFGIGLSFFPDEYDRAAKIWKDGTADRIEDDLSHWPTDRSSHINPVNCHSHNDYWRRIPLFSALQAGCIGVEADVWLFDEELYVGHTTSSLTPRRTLRSLYVDPLVKILEQQNPVTAFHHPSSENPPLGVFDSDPGQSVIFLIDFKTDGAATWPAVVEQLAPLRDRGYLTYFNGHDIIPGPVTVVGTGNTPFNMVTANSTYRDIFFDAPLERLVDDDENDNDNDNDNPLQGLSIPTEKRSTGLGQGHSGMPDTLRSNTFNLTNSYYASVSFKKAIGYPWPFHFTQNQMDIIRNQVRVAHRHGLKVRYWSLPSWPISLRNHVWRTLANEGVDVLNVDDLHAATKGEWRIPIFDWWL